MPQSHRADDEVIGSGRIQSREDLEMADAAHAPRTAFQYR